MFAAPSTLAVPAFAQEVPASDPSTFTGPRVGGILGLDATRPGSSEDDDRDNGNDQSAQGLLYGADIGYDVAIGGGVVGVEGEVSGSTAKVDTNRTDPNYFGYGRVKQGRDLYLGVRAGIRAAPNTLVYAKGGYTNARLDLTRGDNNNAGDRHYTLDGWRLGAGVEQALSNKAYIKAEYRYSNYDKARFEYNDGTNTDNFDVDTDRHQVVVGAGIRF